MPLQLHQRDGARRDGQVSAGFHSLRRRRRRAARSGGGGGGAKRPPPRAPRPRARAAKPPVHPPPAPPRRFVERDGRWHHLAVTWTAADNGLTEIYWDGLIAASAFTGKTVPLDPRGAFMLGGEQDCFGGCTDASQGFYGTMDEVGGVAHPVGLASYVFISRGASGAAMPRADLRGRRRAPAAAAAPAPAAPGRLDPPLSAGPPLQVRLWKTKRSQGDILRHMRWAGGLEGHADLVGYWKFNDPDADGGAFRQHGVRARACARACCCGCGWRRRCRARARCPRARPAGGAPRPAGGGRRPRAAAGRACANPHILHPPPRPAPQVAKDSSGKGNDLVLAHPPQRGDVEIRQGSNSLHTGARGGGGRPPPAGSAFADLAPRRGANRGGARRRRPHPPPPPRTPPPHPPQPNTAQTPPAPGRLEFRNNLALNKATKGMPDKSFTVEFWARGQPLDKQGRTQARACGAARLPRACNTRTQPRTRTHAHPHPHPHPHAHTHTHTHARTRTRTPPHNPQQPRTRTHATPHTQPRPPPRRSTRSSSPTPPSAATAPRAPPTLWTTPSAWSATSRTL